MDKIKIKGKNKIKGKASIKWTMEENKVVLSGSVSFSPSRKLFFL